ncbi:MAG: PAS domain S-box protein [Desulfuromusa sp.]|nr:PAS domain S-box protein [Desulfuromusa sp.]
MKYFNFGSIRKNLTFLVLLSVLPALIILLYTGIEQRRDAVEKAKHNILLLSHAMAKTQENITNTTRQTLSTLALLPEIKNLNLQTSRKILAAVLEKNPNYKNIALTDLKGDVLVSGIPSGSTNLADRKHFKEALKQKDFAIGEYIVSRLGTIVPAFPFAYPVFDDQGQVKAVLTLIINLTRFSDFFEISNLPKNSFIAVTDYKGVRLFYYPSKEKTNSVGKPIRGKSWDISSNAQTSNAYVGEGSDGIRRMFAFEPMRITPERLPYLYMWVGIPESHILGPANVIQTRNVLLMLLATVLALLISWYIGKKTLISPLKSLVSLTQKFAGGALDVRNEQIVRNDEVGTLNQAFYEMADSLNQSQKSLRESQERFKKLSDVTFEGILIHDMGIATDVNESLAKMFGYSKEELIDKNLIELLVPREYQPILKENILKTATNPYEVKGRRKDGTLFPVEIESRSVTGEKEDYRVTALRDITERKKAEEQRLKLEVQLRQKFKMEALGTMAGGMAHNFNNSLAIVLGSLEMAQRKILEPQTIEKYLKSATKAVLRSRDLVSKVLIYSRQGNQKRKSMQIVLVAEETQKLVRLTLPANINLNYQFAPEYQNLTINADSGQIQEALLNLINNAIQSMNKKGTLDIDLDQVELGEDDIPVQYDCIPGTYARLSVKDTGCGMESETLKHIFDPFFTTKGVGQGTGVGLSTVQGMMEQHGGLIKVHSILGEGSNFELYFPVIQAVLQDTIAENVDIPSGVERILFVDDDDILIAIGYEMLGDMGYKVTTENSSKKALEMIAENPTQFDLVITDQTMPELTGKELSHEINKINPELPIILCSGYSNMSSTDDVGKYAIKAFCSKPLRMSELAQVVRKTLDKTQ